MQMLLKEGVVIPVSKLAVSDDGVEDVLEMASDLILSSRFRCDLDHGITSRFVSTDLRIKFAS